MTIPILSFLFGSGVLVTFGKYVVERIKANDVKTEAVCYGVQALLRDRLYEVYDRYTEKGYAPRHVKDNFSNMYKRYHDLGVNGVMDQHFHVFMQLPDRPNKEG